MKDSKLINKLPSGFVYTLTKQGLEQLQLELPDWYEFYMQYSSNNRPGGNEAHKTTSLRLSEVHSLMQVCAIKFGPQKPSLESIHNGGSKNKPYDNVYYMLKELKYEKRSKKQEQILQEQQAWFSQEELTHLFITLMIHQ